MYGIDRRTRTPASVAPETLVVLFARRPSRLVVESVSIRRSPLPYLCQGIGFPEFMFRVNFPSLTLLGGVTFQE